MDKRRQEISHFQFHLDKMDKEITMVLQSLQWNREQLLEGEDRVTCNNDFNHKMPASVLEQHELHCIFRSRGYSKDEKLLPDPIDANASTVVRLTHQDIQKITSQGTRASIQFYMGGEEGCGGAGPEPLSLARLQQRYPAAARRAIHDAVVAAAAPAAPDHTAFTLLSLPSGSAGAGAGAGAGPGPGAGERAARAALRDLRRRRARYRGLCSRNYSDTLRVLIHSQMEFYSDEQRQKTMRVINQSKKNTKSSDNDDEVVKNKNLLEKSRPITKRHDEDSKRAKYDANSQERLREKHEHGKERDYSHTSIQKHPNYSTNDNKQKGNHYSDRNTDTYTERNCNNRYRHYTDEARHNPAIITSNYCDKRHKKLTEKNSLERVQYHGRNKNEDLKLGVSYSSKSSAKKVTNRNYNEKHRRSERERTKHEKDS